MGLYYLLSKTLKTSQKQVVSQVGVKEELPKGFAWKFMLALVLIPVSLLASFILGGQNSKTALVPNLMLKALGVIIVSAVITAVIAVVCDKVRDKKRFNYLRWLCLAFWMISGIVPGFLGLGWEFAACIAGGESFGFYYLFEFIWLQREIKAVLANGQGKNSS
ncbi:MAG: hypothetical protein H6Q73_1296 [Firmicutes bacterium]|nr:hypothetical protein [Bacillota bacterium]